MQGAGKSAIHRIAVLLVFALVLSGCDRGAPLLLVKAVAAGVPSLAPFFDEKSGLGHDAEGAGPQPVRGSLQQGDTPGLYGGTRRATICDVKRLEAYLTDPANRRKAQAWAGALDIAAAGIPEYLDRLTPVLLRHDTLVVNHDYKKGKATPFTSLLQSGIAVLVDERGIPAVKCSCGNPLRPFAGDTHRISVRFSGGNKKWRGYERSSVVAVRPAPRRMERLALVDVHDPGRGIDRPVGTAGARDGTFDASGRRAVPDLVGSTFADAGRRLTAEGLAPGYAGKDRPPDDARVTASDPPPGTALGFGAYVTLSVTGSVSGGTPGDAPGGRPGGSTGGPSAGTPGGSPNGTEGGPSAGASKGTSGGSTGSPSGKAPGSPSGQTPGSPSAGKPEGSPNGTPGGPSAGASKGTSGGSTGSPSGKAPGSPSGQTPGSPSAGKPGGSSEGGSGGSSAGASGSPSKGAPGKPSTPVSASPSGRTTGSPSAGASGRSAAPPSSSVPEPSTAPPASSSSRPAGGGPGASSSAAVSGAPHGSPPPVTAGPAPSGAPVTGSPPPPPGTRVTSGAPSRGGRVTTSAPAAIA
ncbi:DUF6777 domain-containing protein [Streptomyces sp. MCC20]